MSSIRRKRNASKTDEIRDNLPSFRGFFKATSSGGGCLLSNAIKFTPRKGCVQLSTTQLEEKLKIEVQDNGMGIAALDLPHIFDRFYQIDDSSTRTQTGSGIGLALTKELVQLLKGKISVESELGEGTCFKLILPITKVATELAATPVFEVAQKLDKIDIQQQVQATNVLAEQGAPLLLLVEDNEDVLTYIINCLDNNYRILTALNGEQGLRTATEQVPDLIISDVMMPIMDGYALCQQLQIQAETNHIPTILLTAKADRVSKLEGLEKGAVAYLAKPFDKEELNIRVAQTLERQKRLQTHYSRASISDTKVSDPFLASLTALIEKDLSETY